MNEDTNILGTEPIPKLFLRLAIPSVVAQLVNLLYNLVDRIYIGHIPKIGPEALTGVGVGMPVILIITAFSALLAMGAAPLAAIAMGEGDDPRAEKIMSTSYVSLLVAAMILTVIGVIFCEPLLLAFGASENTLGYGAQYLRVYVLGTVFVMTSMGMNFFITTQGFAKEGMTTILIGAILNIILDPIFIYLLEFGVRGAAIATVISQGVSATWVLHFLSSKRSRLHLSVLRPKWYGKHFLRSISLGVSPFIMQSTESLLQIAFNTSLLKYGGDYYVGAMTVTGTIMQLIYLPLSGFTQGGQPIMSYNYGAKNYERVRGTFRLQLMVCFGLSTVFCISVLTFPEVFVALFTKEKEFAEVVVKVLRIYMSGVFILGVQISCQQSFLALGQAKQSLLLALLRKIILLIPLIYILPRFFENKIFGVILAEPVADITAGIVTGLTFLRFLTKHIPKTEE